MTWYLPAILLILSSETGVLGRVSVTPMGTKRHVRSLYSSNTSYKCPPVGSSISVESGTKIRIENAREGEFCTLTKQTSTSKSVPIGRSYNGIAWERSAGPYVSLHYICEGSFCEVTIPEDSLIPNQTFHLNSLSWQLSKRDEAARFLEQTTFGTTEIALDEMMQGIDDSTNLMPKFKTWVDNQINGVSASSHRSFYRRHASSRLEYPSREGEQSRPCEVGARFRWYSFSSSDRFRKVKIEKMGSRYVLSVGGEIRTMVGSFDFESGKNFDHAKEESFTICRIEEKVYGHFAIKYDGNCEHVKIGNPAIRLYGMSPQPIYVLDIDVSNRDGFVIDLNNEEKIETMILKTTINSGLCGSIKYPIDKGVYAKLSNEQFMIFEPGIKLVGNKSSKPLGDGGGRSVIVTKGVAHCANAERTFLNERNCKLSDSSIACAPYGKSEGTLTLTPGVLKNFYELTGRPVYAITDLRLEDDNTADTPCTPGEWSRWITVNSCTENVNKNTSTLIGTLLRHVGRNENPNVKDIYLQDDSETCHWEDRSKRELYVKVEGQCYKTVHPDTYNVYDFTDWISAHPGGPNPIKQPGKQGKHQMNFPSSHPMQRWGLNRANLQYIGRLGDELEFADIPNYALKSQTVAESLGVYVPKPEGQNILVCGSPYEVANDEMSIPRFFVSQGEVEVLRDDEYEQQRKTIWTMIALHGDDQLRQRIAWALSQLLVISPTAVFPFHTESFMVYYDIFVRNAFGSYRDVLREVSYSPMMSDMLTYYESKSSEYVWKRQGIIQYADENYAREMMQLFSVGLVKLNMDGTPVLDDKGDKIHTYDNDAITEYARVWTGFTRQGARGNVEERDDGGNSIDPMKIRVDWRDHFPKLGLDGKYIGDSYPLCEDFPSDSFLRKGAKWKLLGKTKLSEDQDLLLLDETAADGPNSNVEVIVLSPSSTLAKKLCGNLEGKCTYQSIVEIDYNLPCKGIECSLDGIRVVEIGEGIYYEFVQPPCVNFPFFDEGKRVSKSRSNLNEDSACVSKSSAVAAPACCDSSFMATYGGCAFTGERVAYSEARTRCTQYGKDICEYSSVLWSNCGTCCNYAGYFWSSVDCKVFAIINGQGKVAIERHPGDTELDYDSLTFFSVQWGNEEYFPTPGNDCGNGACEQIGTYCRCDVNVENARVFKAMPSRNEILSRLHIGGVDPWMRDYDSSETFNDAILHIADSQYPFGRETMFEVIDEYGRVLYLLNTESIVKIGSYLNFRNTPSFYNAIPEVRDAQYETEAALDHYFYHSNTAPFLALRFIQKFGISNPSPGFVLRVANAFKSGKLDGIPSFGTGKYGDLAATVAAIILDRESRSVVLDADPSHGSLREPLIKVIALMRNLNYQQTDGQFTSLYGLQTSIGEGMHDMPSVFSFFLPEFAPPGEISASSLVSPEAMLLPHAIGTINGMISMIKFGLSPCYGGFVNGFCKHKIGDYSPEGRLMSTSTHESAELIDNLATILTSGRMSEVNRQLIKDLYSKAKNDDETLSLARQLAITSPEFHATGNSRNNGSSRTETPIRRKTCKRHKTVIHLLLKGGCDSFNLLVPHSQCDGNNLNKQYRDERGSVAIEKRDLLKIDASSSLQQCKKFGLHPKLSTLQTLYNVGDALFFAGIGVLTKPTSKAHYGTETKTQLFAHNTLQAEIGRLDPHGRFAGTGTLGRLSDALHLNSYNVNSFSVDTSLIAIEGEIRGTNKVSVGSRKGFQVFNPSARKSSVSTLAPLLNGYVETNSGMYSNTWSASFHEAIQANSELYWAKKSNRLVTGWNSFPSSELGRQLRLVAGLTGSNECRGADRDIYYIETGMYDHHANVLQQLDNQFTELDDALNAFVEEMKAQGKWDDVTIVVSSDFGRQLRPNSGKGTDHGWSGSSFMLGGQVKGGRILGEYPTDLSINSPLNIGRGRLIPTTPFEAVWNGVSEWLGVDTDKDLDKVLPNRQSFPGRLFDENDLYEARTDAEDDCEGEGSIVSCIPPDDDDESLWDDDLYDAYYEETEEGRWKSSKGGTASAIISCFTFGILIGIVIVRKKRNWRLSIFFYQLCGCFRNRQEEKWIYPDGSHETDHASLEVDTVIMIDTTIAVLHLKSQDGVELDLADQTRVDGVTFHQKSYN